MTAQTMNAAVEIARRVRSGQCGHSPELLVVADTIDVLAAEVRRLNEEIARRDDVQRSKEIREACAKVAEGVEWQRDWEATPVHLYIKNRIASAIRTMPLPPKP